MITHTNLITCYWIQDVNDFLYSLLRLLVAGHFLLMLPSDSSTLQVQLVSNCFPIRR